MNKLVSIIVLTYNSEKYIENCLQSIFSQTYRDIEIILIDNSSKDNSVKLSEEKLKNYTGNQRIIINKENFGYAGGNNVGIKESRGEYVVIINPDVVLENNYIEETVNEFEQNPQIGSVQGKYYQLNNEIKTKIIDTVGFKFFKSGRVIDEGQGDKDVGQYEEKREVFGVNGNAAAYRRKTLNDIKYKEEYFDEDFFCYAEDFDLAWRVKARGWKCIYVPQAILWHNRTSSKSIGGGWKEFRQTRKLQSLWLRKISWRNIWLTFIKNLPLKGFFHPQFLKRQIKFGFYLLFFEPKVLLAKFEIIKLLPKMLKKRKYARLNHTTERF
ncbi:MAG: glycosyltransferase family 2 protein [Candidatus Portnoybacteria bacterium]|nr:glycosyltransferase family 2 protein [Candidatus Portnoybacteria bacterium]